MLEPNYSPDVVSQLDALEAADDPEAWNAVCDAIDLICDHPDSSEARAEQLVTAAGTSIWRVPFSVRGDEWAVLWWQRDEFADIYFAGPFPRRSAA